MKVGTTKYFLFISPQACHDLDEYETPTMKGIDRST